MSEHAYILLKDQELYISLTKGIDVPLFFQAHWLDTITKKQWEGWVILDDAQHPIGIISLPYQNLIFWKTYRSPIFSPYSGPYFFDENLNQLNHQKAVWETLWEQNKNYHFWMHLHGYFDRHVSIEDNKNSSIENEVDSEHTTFSTRRTYLLSLEQDSDQLLKNIRSRRRSYLRRAKENYSVEILKEGQWDLWLGWLADSYIKKGDKMPYTAPFLKEVFDDLQIAGDHSLLLSAVNKEHETVAVLWVMYDKQNAYQMWSTFHAEKSQNGCMDLLIWKAWNILKTKGVKTYDFEGSMDPGIARFFKHMGGVAHEYLSITPPTHKIISCLKKIRNL
ncbi:MAG TPA: GNAT family N-acetyltransferase [Chitinophagaceae bacterium]|nr:GNAT family N-acetyltransferase [Chitinophagaceae bacterium]